MRLHRLVSSRLGPSGSLPLSQSLSIFWERRLTCLVGWLVVGSPSQFTCVSKLPTNTEDWGSFLNRQQPSEAILRIYNCITAKVDNLIRLV